MDISTADVLYRSDGGVFDFVFKSEDYQRTRSSYDDAYACSPLAKPTPRSVALEWQDSTVPWRKSMLQSLGQLSGKKMLLIGNGASYKEFHFLTLGAQLIFTDLSLVAVIRARDVFKASQFAKDYSSHIEFHAVDAMNLPFADSSFDIVYGSKFAGFLPDLQRFLSEVNRCLKPLGRCRFGDDAISPAWQMFKTTVNLPRRILRRSRAGSLVEEVRAESASGFSESYLRQVGEATGFHRLYFVKEYFALRCAQLIYGRAVNWNSSALRIAKPAFLLAKALDQALASSAWMRRNALALTWGYDKD